MGTLCLRTEDLDSLPSLRAGRHKAAFCLRLRLFCIFIVLLKRNIIQLMDEEDKLLLRTIKTVYGQLLDERTDIKRTDGENGNIAAEYDDAIERMSRLAPEIHEVFDIYKLEEEDFVFIIEAIEMYLDSFVIDGRREDTKERDEKEYKALESFLDQFYDDSEESEDGEEDTDEGQ